MLLALSWRAVYVWNEALAVLNKALECRILVVNDSLSSERFSELSTEHVIHMRELHEVRVLLVAPLGYPSFEADGCGCGNFGADNVLGEIERLEKQ